MTELEHPFHAASCALEERISVFLKQLDTVFAHIASQLPAQLSLIESATEVIGPENDALAAVEIPRRLNEFEQQKNGIDSKIRNELDVFTTALEKAQKALDQVQRHTLEIQHNCDNLNLFSLNTRLATKQSQGVSASTFRAITLELTERSRIIATLATQLQQTLNNALGEFGQIKETQKKLTASLDELAQKQQAATETGHLHMKQMNAELCEIFMHASQLSDALRPKVRHIMVHIQEQDIIRQSLAHIQRVLLQSRSVDNMSTAERARFIQQASELSVTLISQSHTQLGRFVAETKDQLNELTLLGDYVKRLEEVHTLRADFQQHILTPVDYIEQQNALLQSLLDILNQTAGRWQYMQKELQHTSITGRTMKSVANELTLLEVTMRINGQNDPLLETETNALAADFRQIYTTIRKSLNQISHTNSEIIESSVTFDSKELTLERIAMLTSTLGGFKSDAMNAVDEFYTTLSHRIHAGVQMIQFAADAKARLEKLMTSYPDEAESATYLNHASDYAAHLMQHPSDFTDSINSHADTHTQASQGHAHAQLTQLISEFAVLTQKITAGTLLDINMEQGDDEGELTLF
ncbi:MAG: hypothetical protein JXX14_00535 [Deltaproteobacteria bacterium]|nr:hypothetical protein [Deltaproteobacteria bacterium]